MSRWMFRTGLATAALGAFVLVPRAAFAQENDEISIGDDDEAAPPPPRTPARAAPRGPGEEQHETLQVYAPSDAPPQPQKPAQGYWYGWQTLAADGGSVALLTIGVAAKCGGCALAGGAGYVLAPPIINVVHGNVGYGLADVGVRVVAPFLGALNGLVVGVILSPLAGRSTSARDDVIVAGAGVGFFAGMGAAMIIDAAFLAREKIPGVPQTGSNRNFRILPAFAPTQSGATGGLVGTF